MDSNFTRRAFLTGLGMLSIPLIALAQDREEKKEEAKEKREENKDDNEEKKEEATDDE